ncbi:MAG: alkaline phosphatase family protein [Halobacteriota archaeon]
MASVSIESALLERLEDDGYLQPTYRDYGIANVPDTVVDLLGGRASTPLPDNTVVAARDGHERSVEHVVMVVIDGFGWNRFGPLVAQSPTLQWLVDHGDVTPLTSTFPSETAAAMLTLYTGLQPVEHGQLGWFTYLTEVDRVGLSLPFTTVDGVDLDVAHGVHPSGLFDIDVRVPLASRLDNLGVDVTFAQPSGIHDSVTSRRACGPGRRRGFDTVDGGLSVVRATLERADGPTYQQLYYPLVDTAAHREGTHSLAYREALFAVLEPLKRELIDNLDPMVAQRTVLLVMADHGHVDTDPETNVNLARLDATGDIDLDRHLRRNGDGERIYLAGSPRNVQFYTREGHTEPLRRELERSLPLRTFTRAEYLAEGLFGHREPGPLFDHRAPDLIAVPRDSGLWYDDGELTLIGMHGGLHPHEMLVPFVAVRLGPR